MSEELEKALEFANYRQTLNNELRLLKEKTASMLSYSTSGGTFTIDRELIVFVKMLLDDNRNKVILQDDNGNPISVELLPFYTEILSRYFEVMNDFHAEYQRIRKARNVKSVLDI